MDLFHFKKKSICRIVSVVLSALVMSTCLPSLSISSQAAVTGLEFGVDSYAFLSSLYTLLLSGKVVMDNTSNPVNGNYVPLTDIDDLYEFFDKCNEYQDGLGDELKSACLSGALNGKLALTQEAREDFLAYLEATQGSVPVYQVTNSFPLNAANYTTKISFTFHTQSDPTRKNVTINITSSSPYFIGLTTESSPVGNYRYQFYILSQLNNYASISVEANGVTPTSYGGDNIGFTTSEGNTISSKYNWITLTNSLRNGVPFYIYDGIEIFTQSWPGWSKLFSVTQIADMIASIRNTDSATFTSSAKTHAINSSDEVISSTSTVDPDTGAIASDFTVTVPEYDKLQQVINAINQGVLSLKDALASISASSVKSDASPAEKQQAIDSLVEVYPASTREQSTTITIPSEATTTVNSATEEVSAIQSVKRAISKAIADARGEPFVTDPDDEEYDVGPAGKPYLEDWRFPDLTGSYPDPGGTGNASSEDLNRASDVADGLAFVTGFIGSFFNVSKGFNLVYTVGISFVIFSVLIGASHFFGALFGSHASNQPTQRDLKRSRDAQIQLQRKYYLRSVNTHHTET